MIKRKIITLIVLLCFLLIGSTAFAIAPTLAVAQASETQERVSLNLYENEVETNTSIYVNHWQYDNWFASQEDVSNNKKYQEHAENRIEDVTATIFRERNNPEINILIRKGKNTSNVIDYYSTFGEGYDFRYGLVAGNIYKKAKTPSASDVSIKRILFNVDMTSSGQSEYLYKSNISDGVEFGEEYYIQLSVIFKIEASGILKSVIYMNYTLEARANHNEIKNPVKNYISVKGANVYHDNSMPNYYYSKEKLNLTWTEGRTNEKNVTATLDGKPYGQGDELDKERTYKIELTNGLNHNWQYFLIIDRTAPEIEITGNMTAGKIYDSFSVDYEENSWGKRAPITKATYIKQDITFNSTGFTLGNTSGENALEHNATFEESGIYRITLADAVGNTSEKEIVVVNEKNKYNQTKIINDGYFKSDNYTVKIPYLERLTVDETNKLGLKSAYSGDFSNSSTYLFASKENAIKFMIEIEIAKSVRVVDGGYRYKQANNSSMETTYTTIDGLLQVVRGYATNNVSFYGEEKTNNSIYISKNIVVMDSDVRSNKTKGDYNFISGEFVFTNGQVSFESATETEQVFDETTGETVTIKRVYSYTQSSRVVIKQNKNVIYDGNGIFNKPLRDFVGDKSGLFTIVEYDSVGYKINEYEVYYDIDLPWLEIDYTKYITIEDGANTFAHVVDEASASIKTGDEIDTNLRSLVLTNVIDSQDAIVTILVRTPSGESIITRDLSELSFGENGKYTEGGIYSIKVYDRTHNVFEYQFAIAGKTPTLTHYTRGFGDEKMLYLEFANGAKYGSLEKFVVYRYSSPLPMSGLYEEKFDNKVINAIEFDQRVWQYAFKLGGIYRVVFVDSFGRVTVSDDVTFTKNLPTYTLTGVSENGKTNKEVKITFGLGVWYELRLDGVVKDGYHQQIDSNTQITIPSQATENGNWSVKIYFTNDVENHVFVNFTMDTIPPTAMVKDGSGQTLTWGTVVNKPFKIVYDSIDVASVKYTIDGGYAKTYNKDGVTERPILTENGFYIVSVFDEVGNKSEYEIELDTQLLYKLSYSGKTLEREDEMTVTGGFTFTPKENLSVTVYKGSEEIQPLTDEFTYQQEGEYTLVISDYVGNRTELKITIDKTGPLVVINKRATGYDAVVLTLDVSDISNFSVKFNAKTLELDIATTLTFTNYGDYIVTVADALGNKTIEEFTIEKRPPIIEIYTSTGEQLDNGTETGKSVYFTWLDNTAKAKVSLNDGIAKVYEKGTLLFESGTYSITLTDDVGNKVNASVTVVKAIDVSFETLNGNVLSTVVSGDGKEKTENDFTVVCDNSLTVVVKCNGEDYDYKIGDYITADGEYFFHITDQLGNEVRRTIIRDTVAPTLTVIVLDKYSPVVIQVSDDAKRVVITKDGIETVQVPNVRYEIAQWGDYEISVFDEVGNTAKETFTIVKIPPNLAITTLSGRVLQSGDKTNESVIIECSENLVIKYKIDGGYAKTYNYGEILYEQGLYEITVVDEVGNVVEMTVDVDCNIKLKVVVDGTSVKDLTAIPTARRYVEITLLEQLTTEYSFNDGNGTILNESVMRFENEGSHSLLLSDTYGNEMLARFIVDRTPPSASIDTEEITKDAVVLTVENIADVADYSAYLNGLKIAKFTLSKINMFDDVGEYRITLADALENKREIHFVIKREIDYKLNTPNGFLNNKNITITLRENDVNYTVKHNGQAVELPIENNVITLVEKGNYEVQLTDTVGNVKVLNFTLDAVVYRERFEYVIPYDTICQLRKDGVKIDINEYLQGDTLVVNTDGEYDITLTDESGQSGSYSFVIDTIPPALKVNGAIVSSNNLGSFTGEITLDINKKKGDVELYYNGNKIEYSKGDSISAVGDYKVVIRDEVGREATYTFNIEFTFNAGAIIFFVIIGIAVVLVIALIIRHRIKMKIR